MKLRLKKLKYQVMVVTGASSGIGLATARRAARRGARLVLAARSEADLEQLAQEIRSEGGQAVAVAADVAREEDVQRIAEAARLGFKVAVVPRGRVLESERGIPSRRVVDGLRVVEVDDVFGARLTLELTPPL